MITLHSAERGTDVDTARELFREYAAILRETHCTEGFDAEILGLPGVYVPPLGALLLARDGPDPLGCVAVHSLTPGIAEMKRLYVRPAGRGRGAGRALALGAIQYAREAGYASLRLDTLPSMTEARQLYASLGFRPIPPYRTNPVAGAVYLELELG